MHMHSYTVAYVMVIFTRATAVVLEAAVAQNKRNLSCIYAHACMHTCMSIHIYVYTHAYMQSMERGLGSSILRRASTGPKGSEVTKRHSFELVE
jgi:hypothetical protein